jgi:hypothetical protein
VAQSRGARVLLGGFGGDMAASLAGLGWLAQLARQGRVWEFARALRFQSAARLTSPQALFKSEVLMPLSPGWAQRWHVRRRLGHRPDWHGTPIHPDFAARLKLKELSRALNSVRRPLDVRSWNLSRLSSGLTFAGNSWVGNHCDTMEGPQPLMDRRIWEFVYRVPLKQFSLNGVPRSLYRRALVDMLPEDILRRTSKGWFAPDYRQKVISEVSIINQFLKEHPIQNPIWQYVHRPKVESVLSELSRPSLPHQWDTSYQVVLGHGLRFAHFVSWLQRRG